MTNFYDITTTHHASMASLAQTMGLDQRGAVCLPAVFEACANSTRYRASVILFRAHTNEGLRTYLREMVERLMASSADDIAEILRAHQR